MGESIWNREIEEGLKAFLNSFLFYTNEKGEEVKVPVKIRKPNEDFNTETYPVVFLQGLQDKFVAERYDPTPKVIGKDTTNNTIIIEEAPLPFECIYRIDFYTLYRGQLNNLTQKFLANTHGGRYFNLPVKDQSGNDWDLLAIRTKGGYITKRNFFDDECSAQPFYGSFNIKVQTQLNENVRTVKYIVAEREFNSNEKEV